MMARVADRSSAAPRPDQRAPKMVHVARGMVGSVSRFVHPTVRVLMAAAIDEPLENVAHTEYNLNGQFMAQC